MYQKSIASKTYIILLYYIIILLYYYIILYYIILYYIILYYIILYYIIFVKFWRLKLAVIQHNWNNTPTTLCLVENDHHKNVKKPRNASCNDLEEIIPVHDSRIRRD